MCFASSAERTFRAHTLANMIAESISSPDFTKTGEQASTTGNVKAFFVDKTETKMTENNLKWRVTVADVKMCEMIVELNLSLATADSHTNILIGRELTNFHWYYYYYGFVVYTYCVAHTVSVAWILS